MKYKNLNLAYLFEIIVGFGCIISIGVLGSKGLISLVLIAIRPFILEKEKVTNDDSYWIFNHKVTIHSIVVTCIFIIILYFTAYFIPTLSIENDHLVLLQLIPFFLMTHGVVGIVMNQFYHKKK
jgi:hypothetical protein